MNTLYAPAPASFEEVTAPTRTYDTPLSASETTTIGYETYTPKSVGPKYPPHDMNASILGGQDVAGLVAAVVMALGPLAAYAAGFGL